MVARKLWKKLPLLHCTENVNGKHVEKWIKTDFGIALACSSRWSWRKDANFGNRFAHCAKAEVEEKFSNLISKSIFPTRVTVELGDGIIWFEVLVYFPLLGSWKELLSLPKDRRWGCKSGCNFATHVLESGTTSTGKYIDNRPKWMALPGPERLMAKSEFGDCSLIILKSIN